MHRCGFMTYESDYLELIPGVHCVLIPVLLGPGWDNEHKNVIVLLIKIRCAPDPLLWELILFVVPGDVPEVHLVAVCLQDLACLCLLPEGIICHASVCKCMCTCRVQVHVRCARACAIVVCKCSVQVHALRTNVCTCGCM